MKPYPRPDAIITDRLRSYRAALRELGASGLHQCRLLVEQSCGEFTSAVPAARTRNAPFQVDAKPLEIYCPLLQTPCAPVCLLTASR